MLKQVDFNKIILHCFEIFFSFVSISMGLCACNSAGHLSNHADLAPNHAGVTFAVSNTIVSKSNSNLYFYLLFYLFIGYIFSVLGNHSRYFVWSSNCRTGNSIPWQMVSCVCSCWLCEFCRSCNLCQSKFC